MEEPRLTYEDEVRENEIIEPLWDDVEMKQPLQSYQGCDQDHEKDLLAITHDPNDERNIVLDYSNEFTTYEVFKTREDMTTWLREVSRRNGLVVVVKTSELTKSDRKPVIRYICERGGKYRPKIDKGENEEEPQKKRRKTGTKKCECPFMLIARMETKEGWVLTVKCGVHNHPAARQLIGHSYAGRLTKKEKGRMVELTNNLVRPRDILRTLKSMDETNLSTLKQIYNMRHQMRRLEMAGRSQMQQFLHKLAQNNYIEWHRSSGGSNELLDIFWTHPVNLDLLRTFPLVFVMDCTYKTNKYKLPLLEIVGETSTGKTFMIAFAYLNSEREDNYQWALERLKIVMGDIEPPKVVVTDRELALMNAVKKVFPKPATKNLLCRWHINKNVEAECKKSFFKAEDYEDFMEGWGELMKSETKVKYEEAFAGFKMKYAAFAHPIDYVIKSWLDPYKKRFVDAWTDKYMHIGNKTSNRAECQHSVLKRQLGSRQNNFVVSFEHIHCLLKAQHDDILASFEKSLIVVQHQYSPVEFKELRGVVSIKALDVIRKSCKHASRVSHHDNSTCTCAIRRTHGLPCGHEIARYQSEGRSIPLSCIHDIWMRLSIIHPKLNEDVSHTPELDLLAKRLEACDEQSRIVLLTKIRELACPESSSLQEPQVKTNNKGRPPKCKNKVDTSTKREPSKFEYAQFAEDMPSPGPSEVLVSKGSHMSQGRSRGRGRGRGRAKGEWIPYIESFNPLFLPFIREIIDVEADGNCGFRAIAGLLGFGEGQWARVRRDLFKELHTHPVMYAKLFRLHGRFDEVSVSLDYYGPNFERRHWFCLPEMGYLAASAYNCVINCLGKYQSLTFLPLRSSPVPIKQRTVIAMAHVNGNHFVQVILKPEYPFPSICSDWYTQCAPIARPWAHPYEERIDTYKVIVQDTWEKDCVVNLASP